MFFQRIIQLPKNKSFFLFGGRGTGKTTLLQQLFAKEKSYYVDLLDLEKEEDFSRNPMLLKELVLAQDNKITHIIIDEIQKIPKLLDVVHALIESTSKIFILTGSSSKKLRKGGANLLAGRAFVYSLFPLSFLELKQKFNLNDALHYGTLPKIFQLDDNDRKQFLRAYAQIYLREEIWQEQIVRSLNPFRRFLEVAAQGNGKILNIANIAKDVGVDDKTVVSYFNILEDTLIGFYLEPFHHSFRKRLSKKPKFYFFDTGVVRALSNQLNVPLMPGTSAYGEAFEHYVICECYRLNHYLNLDFKFSFLHTKDDVEIDLVIERPGNKTLLIEIKSAERIDEQKLKNLRVIASEIGTDACEAYCFSNQSEKRKIGNILMCHWQDGIKEIFGIEGISSS